MLKGYDNMTVTVISTIHEAMEAVIRKKHKEKMNLKLFSHAHINISYNICFKKYERVKKALYLPLKYGFVEWLYTP